VILDLSASPHVDVQSAEVLGELGEELAADGIRVQAVEPRSSVRDRLRTTGADEKLGGVNRFRSIADVLDSETAPSLESTK
jgi:MFS superfamily sulfate permease-like transporter